MSLTDPIADALTIIRNASRAKREEALVKASRLMGQILDILKRDRFIQDFRFIDDKTQGFYKVYLRYQKGKIPAISGIKRYSSAGRRFYTKAKDAPRVYGGLGISILSTSKGLLTDEEARGQNIGGEVVCQVW